MFGLKNRALFGQNAGQQFFVARFEDKGVDFVDFSKSQRFLCQQGFIFSRAVFKRFSFFGNFRYVFAVFIGQSVKRADFLRHALQCGRILFLFVKNLVLQGIERRNIVVALFAGDGTPVYFFCNAVQCLIDVGKIKLDFGCVFFRLGGKTGSSGQKQKYGNGCKQFFCCRHVNLVFNFYVRRFRYFL